MKQYRLTHNQFNRIFPDREQSIQRILFRNIYLVEREGELYIEEWVSNLSKFLILPSMFIACLIWVTLLEGLKGAFEFLIDAKIYWFTKKPVRVDQCLKGKDTTLKLLELAKWKEEM